MHWPGLAAPWPGFGALRVRVLQLYPTACWLLTFHMCHHAYQACTLGGRGWKLYSVGTLPAYHLVIVQLTRETNGEPFSMN